MRRGGYIPGSLRARKGHEWSRLVRRIPDPAIRRKAASLVWWDYFGGRAVADRWSHLDDLVDLGGIGHYPTPTVPAIAAALVGLGYPEATAWRRAEAGPDGSPRRHAHGYRHHEVRLRAGGG